VVLKYATFDEEYVQRLTDGESAACDHFVSYFENVLFLKLRVRLRSAQMIEDIRQETFMRVLFILRQGSGVDRPERFGAFVNGVCNNVLREFRRLDDRAVLWDEHNIEEPVDPATDLDASLLSHDLQREIRRVLEAMSERDRRILKAVYLDEMSRNDICRLFQIDPGYLRVMLYRAKEQFRRIYCLTVDQVPFALEDEEESQWPEPPPTGLHPLGRRPPQS
jgi:RNA polymerase sigma-70 factor (ECF subfamily)